MALASDGDAVNSSVATTTTCAVHVRHQHQNSLPCRSAATRRIQVVCTNLRVRARKQGYELGHPVPVRVVSDSVERNRLLETAVGRTGWQPEHGPRALDHLWSRWEVDEKISWDCPEGAYASATSVLAGGVIRFAVSSSRPTQTMLVFREGEIRTHVFSQPLSRLALQTVGSLRPYADGFGMFF